MKEAIIIAVITAVSTVICQFIMSKSQHDKEQAVLNTKLEAITRRLDEHNNYASKIGGLAQDMNEIKLNIVSLQKDVEYLRKGTSI